MSESRRRAKGGRCFVLRAHAEPLRAACWLVSSHRWVAGMADSGVWGGEIFLVKMGIFCCGALRMKRLGMGMAMGILVSDGEGGRARLAWLYWVWGGLTGLGERSAMMKAG